MYPTLISALPTGGSDEGHRLTTGSRCGSPVIRLALTVMLMASGLLVTTAGAVSAAAPSNDRFGNATVISSIPFTDSVDTTEATTTGVNPDCAGASNTVWYSFTPSVDGDIAANTVGSDFDTTLSVYIGDANDLIQVACNDDVHDGVHSAVLFQATAGTTYYLMAGSCCGQGGGALELTVQEFEPLDLDLTIGRGRVDPRTGDAVVKGTITCSASLAETPIYVELRQRRGDAIIVGRGSAVVDCDTTSTKWRALVLGRRAFDSGWARVIAVTEVCDFMCTREGATRVIWLRQRLL